MEGGDIGEARGVAEKTAARAKDRITTGVPGLDDILRGGLPKHRLYLVEGTPGTGKTTLALQFLMEGVRNGESVLYLTLSETRKEILDVAESHHWNLDGIEIYEFESLQKQIEQEDYTVFHPAEVELANTTRLILTHVEKISPTRIVFDSLSELRLLSENPLRYRREILGLKHFFAGRQCTVLLLDDRTPQQMDLQLQSISHGVLRLERADSDYGVTRRRMQVLKMRGVKFREGFHDYAIQTGGLAIYPRLIAAEHKAGFTSQLLSSGIAAFDSLLGGGLEHGTSTLLMGPAGAGKSTIAAQFACSAAEQGERSTLYLFEENRDTFLARSAGLRMKVDEYLQQGIMRVEQVDPTERSPGEFAYMIRKAVEQGGARVVVIDSLNGYINAMPDERSLVIQLHEVLTYLGQQGVVTILVMAQFGLVGRNEAPVEISYVADNVILLRYFESHGEVRQAVSVLKKRRAGHERTVRELSFSGNGVHVGEVLREFSGVLTGVPHYEGDDLGLRSGGEEQ